MGRQINKQTMTTAKKWTNNEVSEKNKQINKWTTKSIKILKNAWMYWCEKNKHVVKKKRQTN